jgi:chaperonin cofactor prefoldin
MVELKKSADTLEELTERESEIKSQIKILTKEKSAVRGTIKSFQKLIAPESKPAKHAKRKRSRPRRSASAPATA